MDGKRLKTRKLLAGKADPRKTPVALVMTQNSCSTF